MYTTSSIGRFATRCKTTPTHTRTAISFRMIVFIVWCLCLCYYSWGGIASGRLGFWGGSRWGWGVAFWVFLRAFTSLVHALVMVAIKTRIALDPLRSGLLWVFNASGLVRSFLFVNQRADELFRKLQLITLEVDTELTLKILFPIVVHFMTVRFSNLFARHWTLCFTTLTWKTWTSPQSQHSVVNSLVIFSQRVHPPLFCAGLWRFMVIVIIGGLVTC